MGPKRRKLVASMLAFASFALSGMLSGCNSGPDVIFVREDLTVDGAPRQILRLAEPVKADVFYYNGETWVLSENAQLPAGWDVVTPAVVNNAIDDATAEEENPSP